MRIAFDHQVFGLHEYSGISRYLHEIASHLAFRTEHKIAVVSPLYVNKYLRSAPAKLRIHGMPVPRLRKTSRIYQAANNFLAPTLLKNFRPDIVHETDYSTRRYAPLGARIVLTVYDMIHERLPESFSPGDMTWSNKKAAVERADHVICISEHTRRDLVELLDVPWEKTSVVHLGFSLTESANSKTEASCVTKPFLLYVGTRLPYKNFDGLVSAYAASTFLRSGFDIVCFGGGAFSRSEQEHIQQAGIPAGSIRQVSGSDAVLAALYRSAHAFVYPSHYEGFGIPPLEAMAFDCPVACSGTSSIPEVVGDAALIFDPGDIEAMRSALERIAGDDALRETLIRRGRDRVKHFAWSRCADETLEVYKKVTA